MIGRSRRKPWQATLLGLLAVALIGAGASLRSQARLAASEVFAAFERIGQADETATAGVAIAANEGKLVLVARRPEIVTPVSDDEGRVQVADGLLLATVVERFERQTSGSGSDRRTTESWQQGNGGSRWYARVRMRDFELAPELLDELPVAQPFALDDATVARLDPKQRIGPNELFYGGGTPQAPQVNDLRVKYFYAPNAEITVLALQRGRSLQRDSRRAEAFGLTMQFDIGVSRFGWQQPQDMLQAQRERIQSGTLNPRIIGAIAIVVGGFLVLGAWGNWSGRGARRHPLQLLPLLIWPFAAFALAPIEELLGARIGAALPLTLASALAALTLAAMMVALYAGLDRSTPNGAWSGPRSERG